MKKYNFYAGPAILPQEVIAETAESILNFNNSGLSVMEISHRSKDFVNVMDEAVSLVKELLNIGNEHEVLFLSGGASSQFYMVPMNLLNVDESAAYIDTGVWSSKAITEAKLFGHVDVVASSKDKNYSFIPKTYDLNRKYKFLHFTSNNTIYGTQFNKFPETSIPLVCDMSSDIFSRSIDIDKFDLIYAGAQKNMGPAGTTLVIVRKSALGKVNRAIPSMLKYENHIENGSMYNTPPVLPILVSMLTLRWIKKNGGVEAISALNDAKANLIYNEIDRNELFYAPANREDRSKMNVCFLLHNKELEKEFLTQCKDEGCLGLEGHRSVGGFRASIYNAMELSSVNVLTELMADFEKKHG